MTENEKMAMFISKFFADKLSHVKTVQHIRSCLQRAGCKNIGLIEIHYLVCALSIIKEKRS